MVMVVFTEYTCYMYIVNITLTSTISLGDYLFMNPMSLHVVR